MSNITADMTLNEFRTALFTEFEGKTKEERTKISDKYDDVLKEIIDRELELGRQGWLNS